MLSLSLYCQQTTDNWQLKPGGLAQLARAPALHAGGQRFDSVILHKRTFGARSYKIEKEISKL